MIKITIPQMFDIKIEFHDGSVMEFECDGEYEHQATIYGFQTIKHVYVRAIGDIKWRKMDALITGIIETSPESDQDSEDKTDVPVPNDAKVKAQTLPYEAHETTESKQSRSESAVESAMDFFDLANVDDEPENIGKDFLKAQLSTKNQMKIRNVLAIISAVAVAITFVLEKLGLI